VGKRSLTAVTALLVGFAGGWLAGEAATSHRYDKLMLDGIHVDAANKIIFDLGLIDQAKTLGCQKVASTLERLTNLHVAELADYGLRPVGASREIIVPSLMKLRNYQIANHEAVNGQLTEVLKRLAT